MKRGLVAVVFLLCLLTAAPLAASPLYGGYNGQSASWIDVFFFGIDDQERWWVRIPLDLEVGLRVNFKYESDGDGVISAEIAGQGLSALGSFLFGVDTSDLTWGEISESDISGGFDSNGNTWSEQSILSFLGTGSDSNDNLWGFAMYNLQDTLFIRVGIDLSFLVPESSMKSSPCSARTEQRNLQSLLSLFQKEESLRLIQFLTALSIDNELGREVATLTSHSLDLESLVRFADEEVFTRERIEMIESMINSFIDAKTIHTVPF